MSWCGTKALRSIRSFCRRCSPFARGPDKVKSADGLGLGLFISERIIAAHSGQLTVQSSREGGTKFDVILPRVNSGAAG